MEVGLPAHKGASYVLTKSKPAGSTSCFAFVEKEMENPAKNKGGRPRKKVKRQEQLAVMCTFIERRFIEGKAKKAGFTISEYLREMGLNGQLVIKTYPPEILQFSGKLNHLAANINQLAKMKNINEQLTPIERAELKMLSEEIRILATNIKKYLK